MRSALRLSIGAGVLGLAFALGGCASPPVQAMSNARQAIAVAEKAGAARYAPRRLAEARRWLAEAESSLRNGNYNRAHWSAVQAEKSARRAAAESRKAHPPRPPSGAGPRRAPASGPNAQPYR